MSGLLRSLPVLLRLDGRVAWRGRLVHVVVLAGTFFGLLARFVLPASAGGGLPWDADALAPGLDEAVHHTVTMLHAPRAPVPFHGRFVPLLLGLDVVLLGLLFGGVLVLQEKAEGTVRAYRVTPGGPGPYLASKVLVCAGLSVLNTLLLVGIAAPQGLASPGLWFLVLGVALTFSLVGIGLAPFFTNLSSFFYPLALIGFALSLPMMAYSSPSLGLDGLRVIPTYEVMFVGLELLFPSGVGVDWALTGSIVVGPLLAAACLAFLTIDRRLLREAT
ncbi:MAG: hypothetical protein ACFCGT_01110 [Sandaracinaceae bacterium]